MATPVFVGKAWITTPAAAALGIASLAGYVSPNITAPKIVHREPGNKEVLTQVGEVGGKIFILDDVLEATIEFIPEGTTKANALLSGGLPVPGSPVTISGMPIQVVGSFADAWNTNGGSTQPWFYEGGGAINGNPNSENWTMTLPLKRYKNITSGTPVT